MRRYVVRTKALSLENVLADIGEDASAVAEGRVFVGSKRVTRDPGLLAPGTEIRVAPRTSDRSAKSIAVLFEDDDFISVDKPAGIPTVPSLEGASHSLVAHVARMRKITPDDLVVTSRLDREVSGVVTFAKNPTAAERVMRARAGGRLARRYVALGVGAPHDRGPGEWNAPIGRAKKALLRAAFGKDAKEARSRFLVVASAENVCLLALAPITGRTHQLRVHASHAGLPLVGDRDYGAPPRLVLQSGRVVSLARIALHCAKVTVPLASGESAQVSSPIPEEIRTIWTALGGAPEAWDRAVACAL